MLHKCMCTEVNNNSVTNTTTPDSNSDSASDSNVDHIDTTSQPKIAPAIPDLPTGCISCLMRKVEFPNGVSHYPHEPPITTPIPTSHTSTNADYTIVFGTYQGVDSSSTPHLSPDEDVGIRWYVCFPLEGEARGVDTGDPLGWRVVSLTLESYAFVLRTERHRFSDSMDDNCQIT